MPAVFYRIPVRVYAIAALAMVFSALLSFLMLSRAIDNAFQMREQELESILESAVSLLADLDQRAQAGEFDEETAKQMGSTLLATMRFGESGYFFAFDKDIRVTVHPFKPEWVGTQQADYSDINGLPVFQEMRRVGMAEGAGEVNYAFQKPGANVPEMKMGYVVAFKPWGWFVGTGAYVSDIHADMAALRNVSLAFLGFGLVVLAIASTVLVRTVTRPLAAFVGTMEKVSHGHYDVTVDAATRRDEIGELGRMLSEFCGRLAESERLAKRREQDRQDQARVVADLGTALQKLSDGDLSQSLHAPFPEEYEQLRSDFNTTLDRMNDMLGSVVKNADEIGARAGALTAASDELSRRTENQAATLEETAAAMDELTNGVRSAADSAANVSRVVAEARGRAEESGRVVQNATGAMSEIKRSSDEIGQIIGVIDDIAFQTNLLALNAGVEAARAGEAGRGFAVVASEVRALAQRSAEAARDIKDLIGGSSAQVESGVGLVARAGEALKDIAERVGAIAGMVDEIASGAQEQSVGLGEINIGVGELDRVTQQNAAMVEEATAATTAMQNEVQELRDLVSLFRLRGDNGGFHTQAA
ncbi:Methyl-accepting chemotaxis protein [Rhodovulum sp. P5]|uniref:methyl-accepting chemotaxis protein n=1 Tax=Rhodovulum sp. P5 TaxID=1564506 RepID=UPI0009C22D2E|nr:methyl-accepting chemotaxis protein [Rhodovulum sp. P5]ARE40092.1 Methyl-accepting chemotaxis protein [Rhodovulum sp. P5]